MENSEENSIVKNGVIAIGSDNYYNCRYQRYDNLDQYIGVPIEVEGFVFNNNDNFAENEFVPVRLKRICCAADLQLVGLLCLYDPISKLETDSWVKVNGTTEKAELNRETDPSMIAQNVVSAKEPDGAYVYPY